MSDATPFLSPARKVFSLITAAILTGCGSNSGPSGPTNYAEQQYWNRILSPRDYLRDLDPADRQRAEYEMSTKYSRQERSRQ